MREEKWVVSAKRADFQKIGQEYGIDPVIARLIRNREGTRLGADRSVLEWESGRLGHRHGFLRIWRKL